jgi:hypothetical protein
MGEDVPKTQSDDGDETPDVIVPLHSPLPPPPDVNYSRPTLKSATPGKPWERVELAPRRPGSPPVENTGVSLGAGMAAGSVFVASVVVGVGIGQWIDQHWIRGAVPWGTILFVLAGVAAGFLNLMRIVSAPSGRGGKND